MTLRVPLVALRLTLASMVALGCAPAQPSAAGAALEALPTPAGLHSGEPFLATDPRGRLHLSWLERTGDSSFALRYSQWEDSAWRAPVTIAERSDFFVNWADYPSVLPTTDGTLLAHWLQRRGGGKYSYDVMLTRSTDDGAQWSEGSILHRDGVAAEHGFVALWPSEGGGAEAAWLDGRGTAGTDAAHHAMSVMSTTIAADGSLGAERQLDLRTCDCCQVAATQTPRGPVVAYRDRTADEVRDIAVVRRVGERWSEPAVVHDDHWQISACPVNGPALASRGDTVVIAWFTGAQDTARVRVAYSTDAGATFAPPQRIDGGAPAGRVDVEMLDDGTAAVSWLERTDSTSAEVRVRRVRRAGPAGASIVLAQARGARASGFPRLARHDGHLVLAWTHAGDSAQVRVARFRLSALP